MSVQFNLILKDGKKLNCSSICYGVLNEFPIRVSNILTDESPTSSEDAPDFLEAEDITHVDHIPHSSVVEEYGKDGDIFEDLKTLFDDLPMFAGMVRVMPEQGVFRVSIAENPADKVMMALLIGRILTHSHCQYSEYALGIKKARELGYTPRVWVIASLFSYNGSRYHPYGDRRYYVEGVNEGSVFNPNTFGMESAKRFMKQDANYYPWFQECFRVNGYKRDDHFVSEQEVFNEVGSHFGHDADFLDEEDAYVDDEPVDLSTPTSTKFRKLVDCFSNPFDINPISPGYQLNRFNEFQPRGAEGNYITEEAFISVLNELEEMRGER